MTHLSLRTLLLPLALLGAACGPKADKPETKAPEAGEDDGVVCTMDAKICPDGSGVGRVGPDCEFAPCPGEEDGPAPEAPDEESDEDED